VFYTYIVASRRNGTLYTGSTDNILKRAWEHREKVRPGFTAKYDVSILVWCEPHESRRRRFGASGKSRNGDARGNCG